MLSGLIDYKETSDGKVEITTQSPFSGETRTTVLDRSYSDFLQDCVRYVEEKELVQNIFNYLDSDTREMLITGITPEEWDNSFNC